MNTRMTAAWILVIAACCPAVAEPADRPRPLAIAGADASIATATLLGPQTVARAGSAWMAIR